MKLQSFFFSLVLLLVLKSLVLALTSSSSDHFFQCLSLHLNDSNIVSAVIHTRNSSSFWAILDSSAQNPIFSSPETPKPIFIVTPLEASHVQATIRCARRYSVHIRTRSGGHDYEGLSYIAPTEFIVIDLADLRSISIDPQTQTAWVQAGATAGELYHEIAKKSRTLAFPAGLFSTVGVGGQFSGGGFGTLVRKYGLAADNIVDAHVVDARGRFLDRQGMGEEFFWAIRGGGGSSFAVVLSWKIRLVDVPSTLTVFNVTKTSEQEALKIIHQWQNIADKVSDDLFVRVMLQQYSNNKTSVRASFPGLYLGPVDDLLPLANKEFPELGLAKQDCKEMSWIESVVWFAEYPEGTSIDVLARRKRSSKSFKGKSDFVQEPIPLNAIRELWRRLHAPEAEMAKLILTPLGGRMSQVEENECPFPHRAGNIYEIQYLAYWRWRDGGERKNKTEKYTKWVESVYDSMTPYVSKSPRGAYINFRDLDLGKYLGIRTKYEEARVWGVKYFKNNFDRLVRVKTSVDPADFFRDEQSIPPFRSLDDA